MKDYNADLSAYLVLSGIVKEEKNVGMLEDINSKMHVHANKLKDSTSGISFKW